MGQVALHRRLEGAEPVVAELGGESHNRGRTGPGRRSEIGDGSEPDELWAFEHDLGDAPLGRGELAARAADPVGDLHVRHPAESSGRRGIHTGAVQLPPSPDRSFASDNAAGAHPAMIGAFSVLRFGDQELPDVVYLEHLTSASYLSKTDEVDRYLHVMESICVRAAAPDRTAELLGKILEEL